MMVSNSRDSVYIELQLLNSDVPVPMILLRAFKDTLIKIPFVAPGLVLPKLRSVHLSGTGVRPYHVAALNSIGSVQTVSLAALDSDDLLTAASIQKTSIQNLVLVPNAPTTINSKSLLALVSRCSAYLTTIVINASRINGAFHVGRTLSDYADVLSPLRNTLRRLTIINTPWKLNAPWEINRPTDQGLARGGLQDITHHAPGPMNIQCMGTFQRFTALEYLETHVDDILYPEQCPPCLRQMKLHPEKYFPHHPHITGCTISRLFIESVLETHKRTGNETLKHLEFLCRLSPLAGTCDYRSMLDKTLAEAREAGIEVGAPDLDRGEKQFHCSNCQPHHGSSFHASETSSSGQQAAATKLGPPLGLVSSI
ncbi:MAG: hypothetical protein Q9218_006577 [Villophora microphyllina]